MDFDGTLLFISHDRYFLNKMAERIVELTPSGTQHFLGNYDEYLEKLQEIEDLKLEQLQKTANGKAAQGQGNKGAKVESHGEISGTTSYGISSSNKPTGAGKNANGEIISKHSGKEQVYELNKEAKREERSRQRRLEQLEQDIARLEGDIEGIEAELAKPEVYNDYVQVQEKTAALEQSKQALEQVYAEWELLVE
jgi:ATP-binding cassette subfamily F protein 3